MRITKLATLVLAIILFCGLTTYASAETVTSRAKTLLVNQTESGFATVMFDLRNAEGNPYEPNMRIEMRLVGNHPDKNAIMAMLLTAISMDELVTIRFDRGSPSILNRVALDLR